MTLFFLGIGGVSADVRPISDTERAVVKLALDYPAGGAETLLDGLVSAPPAGAEWRLVVDAFKDNAGGG